MAEVSVEKKICWAEKRDRIKYDDYGLARGFAAVTDKSHYERQNAIRKS